MRRYLTALVFTTGAGVMSLEMAASRLLAPFFGTSLPVWANLIGLILLALSVGYAWGGRLADRRPELRPLTYVVLAAGGYTALLPLLANPLFGLLQKGIAGTPFTLIVVSFLGVVCLILPPVLLLAFVSPYAIRLAAGDAHAVGRAAGGLYAASTAGSIVGTFLPAFYLIPVWGTRVTLWLTASALIVVAAWGLRRSLAWVVLILPMGAAALWHAPIKTGSNILFQTESPYQYVEVVENEGWRYLIVNEGGGVQSVYNPTGPLTGMYYDAYATLPYLNATVGRYQALVIGAAGGTILRQLHLLAPAGASLALQGVEIDPVVASLGPRYFGFDPAWAKVVIGDGRTYLTQTRDRYDLVVVDAYTQQLYIPFHLVTREFFDEVRRHLDQGGILALNVNALNAQAPLLRAMERTLSTVFPHVVRIHVPDSYNFVLLASGSALSAQPLRALAGADSARPELRAVAEWMQAGWRSVARPDGMLLTDDRAPVEFLTDAMILQGVREGLPVTPGR